MGIMNVQAVNLGETMRVTATCQVDMTSMWSTVHSVICTPNLLQLPTRMELLQGSNNLPGGSMQRECDSGMRTTGCCDDEYAVNEST